MNEKREKEERRKKKKGKKEEKEETEPPLHRSRIYHCSLHVSSIAYLLRKASTSVVFYVN
jgi:hypothetical protein